MQRLLTLAIPVLRSVARELDQSCHLVVPHHGRAVVVAQEDCPGSLSFAVRMGTEVKPLDTASGRVLLAFREHKERVDLVGGGADAEERLGGIEPALAVVRAEGCCEMESRRVRGIRDTSFPIYDRVGHAVAALTVPFVERMDMDPPFDRERVRSVLGAAAAEISRGIGSGEGGGEE
ncbi:MAG: IclR family transcriptional regulator C-terminal domain-containing protein [Planctomycetota bacterium]